jgi:hypothetical protein
MTKTHQHRTALGRLLLSSGLLICTLVSYLALSIGFADAIFVARNRPGMLNRIETASGSDPPDIELLTSVIGGPDWLVAAVAAERIGQLYESDKLTPGQADIAMQGLFKGLASGGHWWRFGWDRDEPEFEQFRGAAIEAVAKFGPGALPMLLPAANSDSPFEREAACWIVLSMLKGKLVDQETFVEQGISERIEDLAQDDSSENVKAACISVRDAMITKP